MDNNYEILQQDNYDIQYIIHISDIHIRKYDRHNEYLEVFNELYKSLIESNYTQKNSIIIITGDILHDKNHLTPNSVDLLKEFFLILTKITTVIAIIGNHDLNLSNNSLDSITPVINKSFNSSKYPIYLLLKNGIYEYNNLQIGLTDLFSKQVTSTDIIPKDKRGSFVKIGLYHGIIHGCSTDTDFVMSNTSLFNQNDFKKYYDYTLLGDIHKHQYLDVEKRIWYAGSLIQQNRDESLLNHGYVLLDIKNKTSIFNRIKNKYGKITLTINADGVLLDTLDHLPEYADIKVICKSHDKKHVDDLYNKIEDTGVKIIEKSHMMDIYDSKIELEINHTNHLNLTNKDQVLKLMSDYLVKNTKESPEFLTKVIDKMKSYLDTGDIHIEDMKCKKIHLISLKFDNLFSYRTNNIIDFSSLSGIVSISGQNNSGKSALLDIIIFAIYGEATRGFDADIMNNKSTSYHTNIKLEVNGVCYVIDRKASLSTNKTRNKKYFNNKIVTIFENNVNISNQNNSNTNIINNKICSKDDFILSCMLLQTNDVSFVELSDKNKMEYLCSITRIDIFDKIYNYARLKSLMLTKIKNKLEKEKYDIEQGEYNKKLDSMIIKKKETDENIEQYELDRNDQYTLLIGYKTRVDILKRDIKNTNRNKQFDKYLDQDISGLLQKTKDKFYQDINVHIRRYTDEIEQLSSKLIYIVNPEQDDIININIKSIETENISIIKKIKILEDNLKKLEEQKQPIKYNKKVFNNYLIKKQKYDDVISDIKNDIIKLDTLKDKIIKYENHEYDPDCQFCMKYNETVEKIKILDDIKTLEQKIIISNQYQVKLQKYLDTRLINYNLGLSHLKAEEENKKIQDDIAKLRIKYDQNMRLINYKNNEIIKKKIMELNIKINDLRKQNHEDNPIYKKYKDIYDYVQDYKNIKQIEEYNLEIKKLENTIADYDSKIKQLNKSKYEIYELTNEYKREIEKCNKIKKELEEKNLDKQCYDTICKMTNTQESGGILHDLLNNKIIPRLNNLVNDLLTGCECGINVDIKYTKGIICIYRDGTKIQMNGGYVNHILNMIFRVALSQINMNVSTNFLFLDETLDATSNHNKKYIIKFIDNLRKSTYNFVAIISHDNELKEISDKTIKVENIKGISKIQM